MKKVEKVTDRETTKVSRRSPQRVLEDIITAAQAEFKENGYERATTAAIARRAKVSESQIYRYFSTKLDIFHDAIFHYIERDILAFYNESGDYKMPEGYKGTRNQIAATRTIGLLNFFRKNSEAMLSLMFAKTYVPNAKGLGEIKAVSDYFDRAAAGLVEYRTAGSKKKPTVNPNLLIRALYLAVLANGIFGDMIFPPGIADEDEINEAVATAIIEGLSAFS